MKQEFTVSALQRQRQRYRGSVGSSQMNQGHGFRAAFRDAETGIIYGSGYADGRPRLRSFPRWIASFLGARAGT